MWWHLWLLGCDPAVPTDKDGTSLPQPWSAYAPPIGEGRVDEVGALGLHVVYRKPTETKEAIGGRWLAHFGDRGWTQENARTAGALSAVDLVKADERLTLIVSAARDRVDIQIEIVDP